MKKRMLSMLLCLCMVMTLLPTGAFATEPATGTDSGEPAVCTCETRCTEGETNADCPVCGAEGADFALCTGTELVEEPAPELPATPETAQTVDEAVTAVQAQIDALPTVDALAAMDSEEQNNAYMALQTAYDAYSALTAEQQALLTGTDAFETLFGWFNSQLMTLGGSEAYDQSFQIADAPVTISQNGSYYVSGTSSADTPNTVTVSGGNAVYLTIDSLSISSTARDYSMTPIKIYAGATVYLTLLGSSSLKASFHCAGIQVAEGAKLVITEESTGSVYAEGYYGGAGIGGSGSSGWPQNAGTIEIKGGTVRAHAIAGGAGIGGGAYLSLNDNPNYGSGGTIIISGGVVNATADGFEKPLNTAYQQVYGAAIGGGYGGSSGNITICGGNVSAVASGNAAGIGSGCSADNAGGVITISAGTVTARGGTGAAAIGSSWSGDDDAVSVSCGIINISGGTVDAKSGGVLYDGDLPVAIGCGEAYVSTATRTGTIHVTGGSVNLNSGYYLPMPEGLTLHTLKVTVNDGRLTAARNVRVKIGDTCSFNTTLAYKKACTGTFTYPFYSNLTQPQDITITDDDTSYVWTGTVPLSNADKTVNVAIGTPMVELNLIFTDAAITENLSASVTAARTDGQMNTDASKGIVTFVAQNTIQNQMSSYGILKVWLAAGTGISLSVTAAALNDGKAIVKDDLTVSESSTSLEMWNTLSTMTFDLANGPVTFTKDPTYEGMLQITYTTAKNEEVTLHNLSYEDRYTVTQSNPEQAIEQTLLVEDNGTKTVNLILKDINLSTSQLTQLVAIFSSKADVLLEGNNTVYTNCSDRSIDYPPFHVKEDATCTFHGDGQLTATVNTTAGKSAAIGGFENSGVLNFLGGTIIATSNSSGAAIGSGGSMRSTSSGKKFTPYNKEILIDGATIIATANRTGAAIGCGSRYQGTSMGKIEIRSGNVTAVVQSSAAYAPAAIGGGSYSNSGNMVISGGNITASAPYTVIGGGSTDAAAASGCGPNLTISGGTLSLTSTKNTYVVGPGSTEQDKLGKIGSLTLTGGSLYAKTTAASAFYAQPVNAANAPVYLLTCNVRGVYGVNAPVTNASVTAPTGYSYGWKDVTTDASGKLYLYFPAGEAAFNLNGNPGTATVLVNNNATLAYPSSDISLAPAGDITFPATAAGDAAPDAVTVTVNSTGNQATGELTVALSGTDADSFALSKTAITSIVAGGSDTFTVAPRSGLRVGTYSAIVTVSGDNMESKSMNVRFTVKPRFTVTLTDQDSGIIALQISTDSTNGTDGTWTNYTAPIKVVQGDSLYVKALLSAGYSFAKWADGLASNPYQIENITENISLTPTAALNIFGATPSNDSWSWTPVDSYDSAQPITEANCAGILTLSGTTIAATSANGMTLPGGTLLRLADGSENTVTSTVGKGIYAGGSLCIEGAGKLTINSTDDGIYADGDFDVSGGVLRVTSGSIGINADFDISISGGDVAAKGTTAFKTYSPIATEANAKILAVNLTGGETLEEALSSMTAGHVQGLDIDGTAAGTNQYVICLEDSGITQAKYARVAYLGTATLSDFTVSGTQGRAVADVPGVIITLTGDTFADSVAASDTFATNIPGLTATVTAVNSEKTASTVTIGGTPTTYGKTAVTVTLPATALTGGEAITTEANTAAKAEIKAAAPIPRTTVLDFTYSSVSYADCYGETVTAATTANITDSGEGWEWYVTGETVTVDGASYTPSADAPVLVLRGVDISTTDNDENAILLGTARIALAAETQNTLVTIGEEAAIAARNLTISGSGALTATSNVMSENAICVTNLTIAGGTITASAYTNAIVSNGGDILITDGVVHATSSNSGAAIRAKNDGHVGGNISITGGTVSAEGTGGIAADGTITIGDTMGITTPIGGKVIQIPETGLSAIADMEGNRASLVTIQPLPMKITTQPEGGEIVHPATSKTLTIAAQTVPANSGNTITYQWYKDGTKAENKISGATGTTYTATEAGDYLCAITCQDVTLLSDTATVEKWVASVTTAENATTKYETMDAAFEAAENADSSTITVLADTTMTGERVVSNTLTLDLNGKTLTMIKDGELSGMFYFSGNFTIKDSSTEKAGTLTNESTSGVTLFAPKPKTSNGILNVESGNFNAVGDSSNVLKMNGAGTANLNGGSFTTTDGTTIRALKGTVNISGGHYDCGSAFALLLEGTDSTVKLSGGTFAKAVSSVTDNSTVAELLAEGYCYYDGTNTTGAIVDDSTKSLQGPVTVGAIPAAIVRATDGTLIGNYATLTAALTAANGDTSSKTLTVTVGKDVTEDDLGSVSLTRTAPITLDFNSKTATGNLTVNGAALTLQDSTAVIQQGGGWSNGALKGSLTMQSGTLSVKSGAHIGQNGTDASLVIAGGTVTFEADEAGKCPATCGDSAPAVSQTDGTLIVTGGIFYTGVNVTGGTTTLNGGKFNWQITAPTGKTVGSLLGEGYAYKNNSGTWVTDVSGNTISSVTVAQAPVKITTQPTAPAAVSYGYASATDQTLSVTAVKPEGVTANISYQWTQSKNGAAAENVGTNSTTYTIPTGLGAGSYVYTCAVTCDGYTVTTTPVTFTVSKAEGSIIPKAEGGFATAYTYKVTALENPAEGDFTTNAGALNYAWYEGNTVAEGATALAENPSTVGTYTLRVSAPGDDNVSSASLDVKVTINPLKEDKPNAPTINYTDETLGTTATLKWKTTGEYAGCTDDMAATAFGWDGNAEVTVSFIASARNNNYTDSDAITVIIPARPDAPDSSLFTVTKPTSKDGTDGKLFATSGSYQYKITSGKWTDWNGTGLTGITDGTIYTIRNKATTNAFASKTVNVTVVSKTDVTISGLTAPTNRVYNGSAIANADFGTPSYTPAWTGTLEYTYYSGTSVADGTLLNAAPINAGNYVVRVSVPESDAAFTGSADVPFTIAKKTVTVKADDKSMTVNGTIPTFTVSYTGFVGTENANNAALSTAAIAACTADGKTTGSYDINITTPAVLNDTIGKNYELKNQTKGTLTVNSVYTPPVSSYDYYTITAAAGEGGSITPNGGISVREGQDKTFNITPDNGYVISDVLVDGISVKSQFTGNSYTFENVSKAHTIKATFIEESKVNPDTGGGNPFTDVKESDWFFEDVMFVYGNKLMLGTSDTTFSPNDTTTRAMVATILWRMEGSPEVTGSSGFTDVPEGKYYTTAVAWAKQNNIVMGYSDTTFGPNDPVTREQLAAFFYRYASLKDYDMTITGSLDKFADKDKVSVWAVDALRWAVGYGVIQGKPGNLLDPQGDATRAQLAAMLHRLIEKNELVAGVTSTGFMGWIDPRRLKLPNTGDMSSGAWPFALCAGIAGCAVLLLENKRRARHTEA